MRWMKWIGLAAAITLVISCFMTWVVIPSGNIVISGVNAEAIGFGKPGYLHIVFTFFFLVFTFIPKVWAKRWNFVVVALNLAWSLRNYFLISTCGGGECPVKQTGLYLLIPASVLLLISALLPDIDLNKRPSVKS